MIFVQSCRAFKNISRDDELDLLYWNTRMPAHVSILRSSPPGHYSFRPQAQIPSHFVQITCDELKKNSGDRYLTQMLRAIQETVSNIAPVTVGSTRYKIQFYWETNLSKVLFFFRQQNYNMPSVEERLIGLINEMDGENKVRLCIC